MTVCSWGNKELQAIKIRATMTKFKNTARGFSKEDRQKHSNSGRSKNISERLAQFSKLAKQGSPRCWKESIFSFNG